MTYQRPQFQILINRLAEPHRFIQVVGGARQVVKTASDGLLAQVCERLNQVIRLGRQHFAHEASPDETTSQVAGYKPVEMGAPTE